MTEREILNAIRALKMGTLLYTGVWLLIILVRMMFPFRDGFQGVATFIFVAIVLQAGVPMAAYHWLAHMWQKGYGKND